MTIKANPTLVEARRGGAVESAHRGAYAIVDADGGLHSAAGDIERPVFPRSAVKVLQALPLVASGAAERFGLTDAQLALACASHGGEPEHVATAAATLAACGLDADALECGAHWPYREPVQRAMAARGEQPTALHNNCSGKHAGFVCLGCWMAENSRAGDADRRAFLRGYVAPEHPVMREVTAALQAATGHRLDATPAGIDGCSIPTHAIPLRRLAHAFARVGSGVGLAAGHARAAARLRAAVAAEPFMVGGTGRFDSVVMQRLGTRVFCKVGAEGVHCAALPELGLGIALKVDDGAGRAAEALLATSILRLLRLSDDDHAFVAALADQPLVNWRGIEVGRLRAC